MKSGRIGKTALLAAALTLTASLSVGSALAYFTSYCTAEGAVAMNMGFTETEIHETVRDGKHIIIENTGDYDCFVRVKVFAPNDIETSYEDFVRSSHNNPDKLVQKKTFLKLREMSIGYNLPKKFISKLSMNSCYVGFIGQNLFVLTKDFRFSDPDGFEDIEGEDISSPSIRYVGVNLKVEF